MKKTILFLVLILLVLFYTDIRIMQLENKLAVTTEFPNIIQEVMPSVVHIVNETRGWQGSGVVISESIIVTARHIVDGGTDFSITLSNGFTIKATRAISSKRHDIGFIKLEKSNLKPARFGSIRDCVLGQPLFAIGSMAGKINFNSVSLGIVSGLNRGGNWKNRTGKDMGWSILFQTDADGMGGNSGCPVFTMDGIVRGIWVGGIRPAVRYSIPADVFKDDIENIKVLFAQDKYRFEQIRPFNDGMEW